jgi:alkylation response protein AidB-like acyl-CoA dehydrogenase
MDFGLTVEQEMVREAVREFTEKEIKPVAALYDEEKTFPYENLRKMVVALWTFVKKSLANGYKKYSGKL